MKVFLDTNAVVSAFAARGLCADVLRAAIEFHELVVSQALLAEVERVLREKFRVPARLVSETLWLLRRDAHRAAAGPAEPLALKDRDDILILSSAIRGGAEVFVTGDREILDLGAACGAAILSPRQFLERILGGKSARTDADKPRA